MSIYEIGFFLHIIILYISLLSVYIYIYVFISIITNYDGCMCEK